MTNDLVERIAKLEAELAALKAQSAKSAEVKPAFKPAAWSQYDPTERMRLPASAAQAMARVVPDVKREPQTAEQVASSWARSRISGPGGFGPADGKWDKQEKARAKPAGPVEDTRSPQTRMFDDMVAAMVGGPNSPVK